MCNSEGKKGPPRQAADCITSSEDDADLQQPQQRRSLRVNDLTSHTPDIAWPTVILAVVALCLWSFGLVQVIHHGFQWRWLCLSTVSAYLCFTPYHDATHRAIGCRRKDDTDPNNLFLKSLLNEVIGQACGIPLLAPFTAFRYIHLLHHKHTNDPEKDPDMHAQTGDT